MEQLSLIRFALIHSVEVERTACSARLHRATVTEFPDVRQFTSRKAAFDLVMLSASHDPNVVLDLLKAKMNVLLVANQVPEHSVLESLYAGARTSGVEIAIVNPDRYLPSRQLIRRQVGSTLGEAGLIRSHRWLPGSDSEQISHYIVRDLDSILWIAGRSPNHVFSIERREHGSAGRYLQIHLGFPGGGMALVDLTNRLPGGDGYASLSVIAASGAAYSDDHHNVQLIYVGDRPQALRTDERTRQYAAMAQEAIDSLLEKRDCSAGLTDWQYAWNVAEAAENSARSGQAIALGGA